MPGQMGMQLDASFEVASSCVSVFPRLALTCNGLHSLWSRSDLNASQCTFFTVWPANESEREFRCFILQIMNL